MAITTTTTTTAVSPAVAAGIEYVRPGPSAFGWLTTTVSRLKERDPFAPVTVLVPNRLYAGRAVLRHLAHVGEATTAGAAPRGGFVNVRALRLLDLSLVTLGPAARGLRQLTDVVEMSAVRAAVAARETATRITGTDDSLGEVGHHPALHQSLGRLFRELRRQEPDVGALLEAQPSEITRAALLSYRAFNQLTADYSDPTEIRRRATACLRRAPQLPAALGELGSLILFLPPRVDPADADLLAALHRAGVPLYTALAALDDPLDLANEGTRLAAGRLAEALSLHAPPMPPPPASLDLRAAARIVRVPDPAEEVKEVVRRVLADAENAGPPVPFHKVAILYQQVDAYGPLVYETLDQAGVPWASLDGRSLADSQPGRALLALLRLRERQFAREAVLEWVDSMPGIIAGDGGSALPSGTWDRLSRAAHVVRGPEQWASRLHAYAVDVEKHAAWRTREALSVSRQRAEHARAMAQTILELARVLQPPRDGSPWTAFVQWAERLRVRFAGGAATVPADDAGGMVAASATEYATETAAPAPARPAWSENERPFAEDVRATLASLSDADEFAADVGTTLSLFLTTLETALTRHTRQQGRPGHGVLVGSVQATTGLTFERVYVLGMVEGVFPPTPGVDPFFPDRPDRRDRRERPECGDTAPSSEWLDAQALRRTADRKAFLTALASADGGMVTLSAPDAYGGRAAFPSRWLLEVASACLAGGDPQAHKTLHLSAFRALRDTDHGWLTVIPSAQAAAEGATTPADTEDRRLGEAARWWRLQRALAEHPMARRTGLPLRAALEAAAARRSDGFTAFDGNLSALAASSVRIGALLQSGGAVSSSGIEMWAACPFRHFLSYVLGVDATELPEDSWTIDRREKGTLVHGVLDRFFRALQKSHRPVRGEPYTDADRALLGDIAAGCFADAERKGLTGHPLVWENGRAAMLEDLHTFLERDTQWRAEHGLTPRYFEQAFGTPEEGAWPPVEVNAGGVVLRFRGYIDRIDVDAAGAAAQVFDYKTGSASPYARLPEDPVLAGTHVQLAVYTRAVRAQLGADARVGGAYWFVTRRGAFKQIGLPEDDHAVGARLESVLDVVTSGIQAGAFSQVPGDEDGRGSFANCVMCDYNRVCPSGRDELWARKRNADGASVHGRLALVGAEG
ncbi:MAG: PD-(D/E)XK nuclease family protein [Chloroflexi bacterium]|nr:PD-(D/E)XK nuclease family protein [Chloroflexota bacterium]